MTLWGTCKHCLKESSKLFYCKHCAFKMKIHVDIVVVNGGGSRGCAKKINYL